MIRFQSLYLFSFLLNDEIVDSILSNYNNNIKFLIKHKRKKKEKEKKKPNS